MIDYTKPSKINYSKAPKITPQSASRYPFVAPMGYALRQNEEINFTTRVVTLVIK